MVAVLKRCNATMEVISMPRFSHVENILGNLCPRMDELPTTTQHSTGGDSDPSTDCLGHNLHSLDQVYLVDQSCNTITSRTV